MLKLKWERGRELPDGITAAYYVSGPKWRLIVLRWRGEPWWSVRVQVHRRDMVEVPGRYRRLREARSAAVNHLNRLRGEAS